MSVFAALLLASAPAQVQPATVYCDFFDEGQIVPMSLPNGDGWDARVRFVRDGQEFKSAFIVGPPLFSSTRGLTSYSVGGSGQMTKTDGKAGQWKIKRFDAAGFLMVRGKSSLELSQAPDRPGHYFGTWKISDVLDGMSMNSSGSIGCEVLESDVPISWDSYRP